MGEAARKLLEEVLQLPKSEREELATELLASHDGDADEGWYGIANWWKASLT